LWAAFPFSTTTYDWRQTAVVAVFERPLSGRRIPRQLSSSGAILKKTNQVNRIVSYRMVALGAGSCFYAHTELSMGPFCMTQSNPIYQLTDPTEPNTIQVEKIWTQPNPTHSQERPQDFV